MWSYAAKVAPADGFSDLAMQVMSSPSKNYILSVILFGVCLLFFGGLLCGRITKRVTREMKDSRDSPQPCASPTLHSCQCRFL
ncbi:unnamed protein product [Ranitomeya imitator]|uniref:Uncharacterized protein n=1 Tax=Ranitomeya imitator TaxID=111125 RepID=A0ABN9M7U1_9NEOB|nr:unnamed protein product [Ranitomeya imitator]